MLGLGLPHASAWVLTWVLKYPSLLSSFLGLETVIFALILIPAGLLIYATYWKNYSVMNAIRSANNPIAKLLNHGYFFDDFYEKGVTKGIMTFSRGVKFFEVVFLEIFPVVFANFVVRFAGGVKQILGCCGRSTSNCYCP